MAGISRYGKAVLGLSAAFVLFSGGWFLSRVSAPQPYQVSASRRPAAEPAEEARPASSYPESLLPGETIDINTADAYELRRLPGIGARRAEDIVAYRTEHGPFETIDELDRVEGIGPGIIDGLRDYAAVGSP